MRKPGSSKRARRALRGGSRGMTLIEVVVALALLGIIAVTFLGGLTAAARAALLADVRTTAESLARTQMEYVKSQGYQGQDQLDEDGHALYLKIDGEYIYIPPGYTVWSVSRDDLNEPVYGDADDPIIAIPWDSKEDDYVPVGDGDKDLQKITLVIKHEDKVIFTLEGYKMHR